MSGLCAVFNCDESNLNTSMLLRSINLSNTKKVDHFINDNIFFGCSFLENCPTGDRKVYSDKNLVILFCGDLIEYKNIPWDSFAQKYFENEMDWFTSLKGYHSILIYSETDQSVSIFTDSKGQSPLYYGFVGETLICSSNLATFTLPNNAPTFNENWLYEYIMFNMPIGSTTFLKGIERVKANQLIKFDLNSKGINKEQLGRKFIKSKLPKDGKKHIEEIISDFQSIVPKYFLSNDTNLVALTSGFDSRTVLSLAPKNYMLNSYTYGVEGSDDLLYAKKIANILSLNHDTIHFDQNFRNELKILIYDTVRLSGGLQSILRSTLLYVFRELYARNDAKTILGGINGDIFRGWDIFSPNPSILSNSMAQYFQKGKFPAFEKELSFMFIDSDKFKKHISSSYEQISKDYGNPLSPECKINWNVYSQNTHYFAGEFEIANLFFTMRQPFLDDELIKWIYQTEYGHVGQLKRTRNNGDTSFKQFELMTKIISENKDFKKIHINGMPLFLYAYGNKFLFQFFRPFIRGWDIIKGYRKNNVNLEDWSVWFENELTSEIEKLLDSEGRLAQFIKPDTLNSIKKNKNLHLINKLATTEIILDLIQNKWNIKSQQS